MRVLYLHGIGSGAASRTPVLLAAALPGVEILRPELPVSPSQAVCGLREEFGPGSVDLVVGSSLGGFYALLLPGLDRLLVNPALFADEDIAGRIGLGPQSFLCPREDGATKYVIDERFIDELRALRGEALAPSYVAAERDRTHALFGRSDELLDHYGDFVRIFGEERAARYEGEHRLSEKNIREVVAPWVRRICSRDGFIILPGTREKRIFNEKENIR